MQRRTHRQLLIVGIGLSAVGLMILMMQLKPEPEKKEKEDLKILVDVMQLEESAAVFEIRSQGTVKPLTQTTLSAEVSGAIVSISPKFVAGGIFQKHEQLMRIDPTNYAVAVDQANALLLQRQIEFDGASKLRTQGYRAESEYASAAAALATAKAGLVRAEYNLARTYIRVPYEGMVKTKEADLGQFVNAGARLGLVFATDFAEVRLPLTDQDLAFVELPSAGEITKTGEAAGPYVKLTAVQKGQLATWDAQIVRSEGTVDELSRVTYAVARVDDPYRLHQAGVSLPIGTFVGASIAGKTAANVIRVPRSTIRGANELIFIDTDNRLEIRSVQLIRADGEYAFIGGGAEAGERIMLSAIEAPSNGMLVRTTDRPDPVSGSEPKPEADGEQVTAQNNGRDE
jgi:RND family efflux transporter MFP subunit